MSLISLLSKKALTPKAGGAWHLQAIRNKHIICRGRDLSKGTITVLKCIMVKKKGSVLIVSGTGTLPCIALSEYRRTYCLYVKPQVTTMKWLEAGYGLGMLKGNYVTIVNKHHQWQKWDRMASQNNEDAQQTVSLLKSELHKILPPSDHKNWQTFEKHGWTFR